MFLNVDNIIHIQEVKSKGKGHPRRGLEGPKREQMIFGMYMYIYKAVSLSLLPPTKILSL